MTRLVGFNAGDQVNAAIVVDLNAANNGALDGKNIFRLDGMQ